MTSPDLFGLGLILLETARRLTRPSRSGRFIATARDPIFRGPTPESLGKGSGLYPPPKCAR
jgi:hypothetical protein